MSIVSCVSVRSMDSSTRLSHLQRRSSFVCRDVRSRIGQESILRNVDDFQDPGWPGGFAVTQIDVPGDPQTTGRLDPGDFQQLTGQIVGLRVIHRAPESGIAVQEHDEPVVNGIEDAVPYNTCVTSSSYCNCMGVRKEGGETSHS